METIIITGVSGAGKTQAIDYLEDFGFFCIDNMPIQLLSKFIDLCIEAGQDKIAVVTDIRSIALSKEIPKFRDIYKIKQDNDTKILYMDSDDSTIVKRYQQSRRRHPLSITSGSLEHAIGDERAIMKEMKDLADVIIDTSELKPSDLYEHLKEIIIQDDEPEMILLNFISFGFKYGVPKSADFVFDTRFLVNPFWVEELREKTGQDVEVQEYVMESAVAKEFLENIHKLLVGIIPSYLTVDKTHITIAIGCTGGQHRSVTITQLLAERFRDNPNYKVRVEHRDINKDRFLR